MFLYLCLQCICVLFCGCTLGVWFESGVLFCSGLSMLKSHEVPVSVVNIDTSSSISCNCCCCCGELFKFCMCCEMWLYACVHGVKVWLWSLNCSDCINLSCNENHVWSYYLDDLIISSKIPYSMSLLIYGHNVESLSGLSTCWSKWYVFSLSWKCWYRLCREAYQMSVFHGD